MPNQDATTQGSFGGSSQAINSPLTIGAGVGNNRILVAFVGARGSSNAGTKASSIAFDNQPPTGQLSDVEVDRFGNFGNLQGFYWLDGALPVTAGTYALTGTTGFAAFNTGVAQLSATLAAQTAPTEGVNQDATNQGDSTVTVTTTAGNAMVLDAVNVWHGAGITNVTPTAGQTEAQDVNYTGNDQLGLGYETVPAAGAEVQTWDWAGSALMYAALAVAINHSGSPSVGIVPGNQAAGVGGTPFSHTLTAAPNRGVLIEISDESTAFATAVTWNGTPAQIVNQSVSFIGAGNTTEQWVAFPADSVPAGPYTVSVTHPGGAGARVRAVELNNIDQQVPAAAQRDTAAEGSTTAITATATRPSSVCLATGCAGHGLDPTPFDATPSGTGTWSRRYTDINPPTSSHFVGADQFLSAAGGTLVYSETAPSAWNRASSCVAIWSPADEAIVSTFFRGQA